MSASGDERLFAPGATSPMRLPTACPILVGRSSSLAQLVWLAERAADEGQGAIALVSGDAGIGKSRLLLEARTQLLARATAGTAPAYLVREGRCFEEDRHVPYAALLDLFRRSLGRDAHGRLARVRGELPAELTPLLPRPGQAAEPVAGHSAAQAAREKRQLQDALLHLVADEATRRPVLLIVEDVHWADDASLEFLHYLARHLTAQPMLLVLTYRATEVSPGLGHLLATLQREHPPTEIRLHPLALADVEAMLRAIFAQRQPIDPAFLQTLYAFTEGNPFFVEETLRSLVAAGDTFFVDGRWDRKPLEELHIPRAVRVAVQQRLPALGGPARQLLALAAVAGRRFDATVLQAVSGQDEATLVAALKELIAAQFVVEETADVFAFRHALIREAVYRQLLSRERRALHAAVAATLTLEQVAAGRGAAHAADLAHHLEQAGDWTGVLTYAQRAGEQALRVHALSAAIAQFTRTLEAAQRLALPPPLAVLRLRGEAHEIAGHFPEALADFDLAVQTARSVGDAAAEWQGLGDLAQLWTMRDYSRAGAYYRQAVDRARELGDPVRLTSSLNQLGTWYVNRDEPASGRSCHREALTILAALSDRGATAEALHLLGESYFQTGDQREGTRCMARAATICRELGDQRGYAFCLAYGSQRGPNYTSTVSPWLDADAAECLRQGERALAITREVGWRACEAFCHAVRAFTLGPRGHYTAALEAAQQGRAIAEEIGHGPMTVAALFALGALYLDLLLPTRARALLEHHHATTAALGLVFATRQMAALHAAACLAAGDLVAAQRALDGALDPALPMTTLAQRHLWYVRAELALACGEAEESLRLVDRLIAALPAGPTRTTVIPRLWTLRGRVLSTLGEHGAAAGDLQAAVAAARDHEARSLLWRAQVELARVSRRLRRRADAATAEGAARETIQELAAALVDEGLRATFLRSALAQLPQAAPPTPNQAAKQHFDGLTARERQVAALVRCGLSNRAAAAELVVSERTFERHVANIMAKLGVSSRSQIAVWAAEKGLPRPAD